CAVTGVRVGSAGATVVETAESGQRELDDLVRLPAVEADERPQAARLVLEARIVERGDTSRHPLTLPDLNRAIRKCLVNESNVSSERDAALAALGDVPAAVCPPRLAREGQSPARGYDEPCAAPRSCRDWRSRSPLRRSWSSLPAATFQLHRRARTRLF